MSVYSTRINIYLPEAFLQEVDRAARSSFMSRSDFIRLALMQKMGLNSMVNISSSDEDSKIEAEVEKRVQKRIEEFMSTLPDN